MSDTKNVPMLETDGLGNFYSVKFDDNGNEISRTQVYMTSEIKKKPKMHFKPGGFTLMSMLMMELLESKKDYSNLTFRLLFALMRRIDFDNRIKTFRQAELAEALEAKQPHVSKSLRILIQDEIIEKRGYDYYFTESFIKFAESKAKKAQKKAEKVENNEENEFGEDQVEL